VKVMRARKLKTAGRADPGGNPSEFRLTYVIGTYPRLTTTFIDREIRVLRRLGIPLQVISIRRPNGLLSAEQKILQSDVYYVLPASTRAVLWSHLSFMISRPLTYLGTLLQLVSRPHPTFAARQRTILHFGLGVHIARMLRDRYPTDHIHAHFVDRAALVALIAGRLLTKPFSATAHANDIYVDPVLLPEKIAKAKFIAAISRYNESHLRAMLADGYMPSLRCIYNGIEVPRYRPQERPRQEPPLILSVGQLKEKKGFRYLIQGCAYLRDRGSEFNCDIVGEGPLGPRLEEMIDHFDLRDRVSLLGALPHEAVMEKYAQATMFVLPCVMGPDGDRDGIPTVILEAMAMGLPVVSTDLSGIPEAVLHGTTGMLVEPKDPNALADALGQLLDDGELSRRMGLEGRRRVVETFDSETNVKKLLEEFML
jgi:colanic acid/amylovoran biosynthesis glycosyltransferase